MTEHRTIGTYRGVTLDVAAWDAVGAQVDLSCAGMFARELGGAALQGGLLDLDTALDCRMTTLRRDGAFRGEEMETLLIPTPPAPVRARAVLVIGLGMPETWSAALMERATRVAIREAVRFGAASAGIAPGLLDSGLTADRTGDSGAAMLRGVTGALDAEVRLAELGLAPPPMLARWVFGAGAAHLDAGWEHFRTAFAAG